MERITPILKSLQVTDYATDDLQAGNSGAQQHKCINDGSPEYLAKFCHPGVDRHQGMRSADGGKLHVPCTQSSFGDMSFAIAYPRTWNNLPDPIRDSSLSFSTFAKLLKSHLFDCRSACDI